MSSMDHNYNLHNKAHCRLHDAIPWHTPAFGFWPHDGSWVSRWVMGLTMGYPCIDRLCRYSCIQAWKHGYMPSAGCMAPACAPPTYLPKRVASTRSAPQRHSSSGASPCGSAVQCSTHELASQKERVTVTEALCFSLCLVSNAVWGRKRRCWHMHRLLGTLVDPRPLLTSNG